MSTDKGLTWTKPKAYPTLIDSNNLYYRYKGNQFSVTKDFGNTWEVLYTNDLFYSQRPAYQAYNKKFDNFFFLCSENEIVIFKKIDTTWTIRTLGYPFYSLPYRIYLDNAGDYYLFCENKIRKSNDGGYNWEIIKDNFPYLPGGIVEIDSEFDIFIGENKIIRYKLSTNTFTIRQSPIKINSRSTKSFRIDNKGDLIVSSVNKLYKTSDLGLTWNLMNTPIDGLDGGDLFCSKSGNYYLSYYFYFSEWELSGLLISTDYGASWNSSDMKLSDYRALHIAEMDDGRLFAGANAFYYSDDNGKTWTITTYFAGRIISISTYGEKNVFITLEDGYIYFSEDRGESFDRLNTGFTDISCISVKFNSKGDMYIPCAEKPCILYSTNLGKSFSSIPVYPLTAIGNIFFDKEDNIYYTYDGKLYISKDNGVNWKRMDQGILGKVYVSDILFIDEKTAFLGTWYNGIYRTDNYTDIKEKGESSNTDMGIYPNPATDYITLTIPPLEKRGLGGVLKEIKIFDIFGEPALIVGAIHELPLRIDISSLPAGVYFVKIGEKVSKFVKM